MATNKAKRSIHLAQPQPQHGNLNPLRRPDHEPVGLIPVKAHIYHTIAELNAGLEKAILNLKALQNIHFFRSCGLAAMNNVLCGIRSRANRQLMMVANERETANAGRFQQFSVEPKNR